MDEKLVEAFTPYVVPAVVVLLLLSLASAVLTELSARPLTIVLVVIVFAAFAYSGIRWSRWRRENRLRVLREENRTLDDLLGLTATEFELAVRQLLLEAGFQRLDHTGRSGDLAADLVGLDEEGRVAVVQCKRYAPGRPVGSPDVQTFIGMLNVRHGAERGVFATTSTFTRDAIALGQHAGITLLDGRSLAAMARRGLGSGSHRG